jgi:hypothetical protein
MTSAVLILPAAYRDAGNAFGVAQGWGEDNFSVPLSADGAEPATHYGCRPDVQPGFFDLMAEPPVEAIPLLQAMISSFEDNIQPYDHWIATLEANNLKRVESSGTL